MQRKSAFTFIEIMIAIVIFSIGILTVMRLITDNLETMDQNNLKIQATLLAKEGIELVYNMRDANLKKELSWNCLINEGMYLRSAEDLSEKIWRWEDISNFEEVICVWYFGENNNLQVSFDMVNYMYHGQSTKSDIFYDNYQNNKLYLYKADISWYPVFWYGHELKNDEIFDESLQASDTFFARYLSFEKIKEWDNNLPEDKIMKIESHVLYMKWWNTGEVIFESFIWNY